MKKLIGHDIGSYAFLPGAAGAGTITITLPTDLPLTLEQILLVTNAADNVFLYNFADPTKGGSLSNGVLTLAMDTSAMSAVDPLQVYVDLPDEDYNAQEAYPLQPEFTMDINLAQVLGTLALAESGQLRTKTLFQTARVVGGVRGLNDEFSADVTGYQTAALQVSGTWAGTLTFEAMADGGNYVAISGIPLASGAPAASTTGNGIWRFSIVGLQRLRVRCSAYTSGAPILVIALSAGEGIVSLGAAPTGSQGQALSQKATSFELNTYDTNMAAILGTASLLRTADLSAIEVATAPTQNPAAPAVYPSNLFAKWPQRFPRVRVESGGSEKLPFAQEPNTNKIIVANPDAVSILGEILVNLQTLVAQYAAIHDMTLPAGMLESK